MLSGRRAKLSAILGLILVFITVILFMRFFPEQESLHWTALFFIILGETLPVAVYIRLEESHARSIRSGFRIGVYSLLFIYGLTAVLMALVLLLLEVSASLIATLELVLALAFGAILLFATAVSGDGIGGRRDALEAMSFMRMLGEDVNALAREPVNRPFGEQLYQIEEAIKYGDHSGLTSLDTALAEKIRELNYVLGEGNDDASGENNIDSLDGLAREKQVNLLTDDLLRLLQSRNRELINNKKARTLRNG